MSPELLIALAAVVTAVVAAIVAVSRSASESKKASADTIVSISTSYAHLVGDLRDQLKVTKTEVGTLKAEIKADRQEMLAIRLQLQQALERIGVLEAMVAASQSGPGVERDKTDA